MDDLISRQAALTALAEAMPSLTTPDGCGQFDHDIQVTDEAYVDCMRIIHDLPSAQPDVSDINVGKICEYYDLCRNGRDEKKLREELLSAQPGWIPCTPETMPKMTDTYLVQVGINENGEGMHTEVRTADWNVVWHEWYVHTTRCFVGDIIKWMPIPWEGGQE